MPKNPATPDARVVFTPSGKRGHFSVGTPILQAAQTLGVDVDSVLGDVDYVDDVQVVHATGNFPKHHINSKSENISPISETEKAYAAKPKKLARWT